MYQIQTVSNEELELLKQFDTPTICNVIELFDVRSRNIGYMDQRIKSNFPEMPPMVGYATTATFRSNSPPRGNDAYSGLEGQIDQLEHIPEPRIVVFQDLDSPTCFTINFGFPFQFDSPKPTISLLGEFSIPISPNQDRICIRYFQIIYVFFIRPCYNLDFIIVF